MGEKNRMLILSDANALWQNLSHSNACDTVIIPSDDWRSPVITLTVQKDLVCCPGSKAIITYLEGGNL